jgi:hypothetical protein
VVKWTRVDRSDETACDSEAFERGREKVQQLVILFTWNEENETVGTRLKQ